MQTLTTYRPLLALVIGWLSLSSTDGLADDTEPILLPNGESLIEVDFERHVTSLFSKLGCNAANCHGSFQGRGDLRLSLFGYSSRMDFEAFTANPDDGRVDREDPEFSLMLLKPSGGDEHQGGIRFETGSWEYRVIERWIANGAQWQAGTGLVDKLAVEPGHVLQVASGNTVKLSARARFADGTVFDVSPLAEFRSNDESIAFVDSVGNIQARQPGDTAVIVSYRGVYVAVRVIVPIPDLMPGGPQATDRDRPVPSTSVIDDLIATKLKQLNLDQSPRCDDATFLRRVTLDTIGTLPLPEEVMRFLADDDSRKRAKKIDELLAHPMHAALWATRMCDITGCNADTLPGPDELKTKRARMWHDWFRRRFERNAPYDQIAMAVINATSRDGDSIDDWMDDEIARVRAAVNGFETNYADRESLDLFWKRTGTNGQADLEDMTELIAAAFMGVRMNCARCHKHPFDRWTQQDYLAFANTFAGVKFDSSTELRSSMLDRLEARRQTRAEGIEQPAIPRLREVYLDGPKRRLRDEETGKYPEPRAPHGPTLGWDGNPRERFAEWLVTPGNPYFAASFVNRVWAMYLGRGFVEPVDAFSIANPPSHPQLLEHLAKEFERSGYDIRRLERAILMSDTYQRSAQVAGNNAVDNRNFSHALVRPLLAEVVLDAIDQALQTQTDLGRDAPAGARMIELATNRPAQGDVASSLRVFGRGERTSLCDCDRASDPDLRQPLFLMSDARLLEKIEGGRLARLLESDHSDDHIIRQLYLATLSRLPDDGELAFACEHVQSAPDRRTGMIDLMWGLINTREFITNH